MILLVHIMHINVEQVHMKIVLRNNFIPILKTTCVKNIPMLTLLRYKLFPTQSVSGMKENIDITDKINLFQQRIQIFWLNPFYKVALPNQEKELVLMKELKFPCINIFVKLYFFFLTAYTLWKIKNRIRYI